MRHDRPRPVYRVFKTPNQASVMKTLQETECKLKVACCANDSMSRKEGHGWKDLSCPSVAKPKKRKEKVR